MVACSTTLAQAMTMQAHGCSRRWDPVAVAHIIAERCLVILKVQRKSWPEGQ